MTVTLAQRMDMQKNIWNSSFVHSSAMFGTESSFPAHRAAEVLRLGPETTLLELPRVLYLVTMRRK